MPTLLCDCLPDAEVVDPVTIACSDVPLVCEFCVLVAEFAPLDVPVSVP